jgi:Rab-3A-interacting protein
MAETEENGVSRHSRTSSTTSSTSTDDGLVLSVAGLKSAGPKKDRPNSGNNNSGGGPNSLTISEIEVASLRAELEAVRGQLNAKDKEVAKLGRIRDELENEVQDLTASLFEEAHKMVGAANIRAAASERSFGEASMKIDGLETEVAALKDLVLTSTPSKPNRHLHPQISNKKVLKIENPK